MCKKIIVKLSNLIVLLRSSHDLRDANIQKYKLIGNFTINLYFSGHSALKPLAVKYFHALQSFISSHTLEDFYVDSLCLGFFLYIESARVAVQRVLGGVHGEAAANAWAVLDAHRGGHNTDLPNLK